MQIVAPFLRVEEQQVALSLASKVLSRKDLFSGLEAPKSQESALKLAGPTSTTRSFELAEPAEEEMSLEMEGGSAVLISESLGLLILEMAHQNQCLSGVHVRSKGGQLKGATQAKQVRAWQDCKVM